MAPRGGSAASRAAAGGAGQQAPDTPGRMPYEQARDELTALVSRLEAGGLSLEESLQLWERGEELATICEEWLEGARARLSAALARQSKPADAPDAPGAPF